MKTSQCLVACVLACAVASASAPQAKAAGAPPAGWRSVSPGFPAQVLLAHGTAMWAAGSGESIAVSMDAGQHWQRRHHDPKGALLLVLNIVDDRFGYAAGTGGKVLFTQDGGETWRAQKLTDEAILQAAFGDAQHGVIRTLSALLSTTDGGKSWQPIVPVNDPDWVKKYPSTVGIAALDKGQMAARVSEGPFSDGEFLWTGDGGLTWNANYIPSSSIQNVMAASGSYWSFGGEVLGKDKPDGGYSAPMAFYSKDGIVWEHTPLNWEACHWGGCGGCTPQGCFAGKSSFFQFLGGTDWMAKFPAHEGLSSQWAKSGDALCLLSRAAVECTTLQQVKTLNTEEDSPAWESHAVPAIGWVQKSNPQCIRCQLDPIYISKTGNSGPAEIQISFVLEDSGQVNDVAIVGSLPDDVVAKVRDQVRTWFFESFLKDGLPTATMLGIRGRIMVLNPDKPQSTSGAPSQGSTPAHQ